MTLFNILKNTAKIAKKIGLKDYFWRLKSRLCAQKALIAVTHKILRIIYSLTKNRKNYQENKKDQRKTITSVQMSRIQLASTAHKTFSIFTSGSFN